MPRQDLWPAIGSMSCCVSSRTPVTLHHCHGGSMSEIGIRRGLAQKTSDWLVIPLHEEYHTGRYGIDSGHPAWGDVNLWESEFGTQREHLIQVCLRVGVNVFKKAGYDYSNYWLRNL